MMGCWVIWVAWFASVPVLTGLPGLLEFWVARLLQRVIKASTLFYGQLQLVNATPHFFGGQLALNHRES